jgi:cell wall-associated NlpC family hydrolase
MIQEINRHLADILAERSLDWRSCYSDVTSQPPDGRTVVCQCSDSGVLEELERRLRPADAGLDRVRFVTLPAPDGDLPAGLIAASSAADVRRAPSHASELVTQIVYGDAVEALKQQGDWYLVRLDDTYIGWIRSWHLADLSPEKQEDYASKAAHRVSANHAVVLESPAPDALPVTDLVVGTVLSVSACGRRGWRAVTLPDGKEGFVTARSIERIPVRKRISRERLSATGLRFLGIPYIWGGTTPKGFDCSGLMQRIFRLNGTVIPRDADQQSRFGHEKPAGAAGGRRELSVGDLIFFGKSDQQITHVAMVLSEGLFLHAYGQVRVGSLDPRSPLYEGRLIKDWRITRDIVSFFR